MKIVVCDFCRHKVEEGNKGVYFKYKGKHYRIDISVFKDCNQVRASRTDACPVCTIKYAVAAAKFLLKQNKKK